MLGILASHKALNERLRVLRDRVNSEESNLTKLRQLRGEIEHRRTLAKEAGILHFFNF